MKIKIIFFCCLCLFISCKKYKAKKYKREREGIYEITIINNTSNSITGIEASCDVGPPSVPDLINTKSLNNVGANSTVKQDYDCTSLPSYDGYLLLKYTKNSVPGQRDFSYIDRGNFVEKGVILNFYNDTVLMSYEFWPD